MFFKHAENDHDEITKLKELLAKEFEVKDLGILRHFLDIYFSKFWILKSSKRIFVSQRKYVLNLLQEMSVLGCKPANAAINPHHNLRKIVKSNAVDICQH